MSKIEDTIEAFNKNYPNVYDMVNYLPVVEEVTGWKALQCDIKVLFRVHQLDQFKLKVLFYRGQ